jgi:hypothetical protein
MTDRATLLALADRVERASGADDAPTAEIALALGWRRSPCTRWWISPDDGQWRAGTPPLFLISLDAAASVVPATRPWLLEVDDENTLAQVLMPEWHHTAQAPTPALALCAAALRARAEVVG